MDNHFLHHWSNANLEKDYWSIVGFNSRKQFEEEAYKKFKLLQHLGLNNSHKILDVGCGTGTLVYGMQDEFVGEYIGLDIHQKAVEFCRRKYPEDYYSFFLINNNRILHFGKEFNFIVFYSVFTHVMYNEIIFYLDQSFEMLAKDGKICFDIFIGDKRIEKSEHSVITYNDLITILAKYHFNFKFLKREKTQYQEHIFDRVLLEARKI